MACKKSTPESFNQWKDSKGKVSASVGEKEGSKLAEDWFEEYKKLNPNEVGSYQKHAENVREGIKIEFDAYKNGMFEITTNRVGQWTDESIKMFEEYGKKFDFGYDVKGRMNWNRERFFEGISDSMVKKLDDIEVGLSKRFEKAIESWYMDSTTSDGGGLMKHWVSEVDNSKVYLHKVKKIKDKFIDSDKEAQKAFVEYFKKKSGLSQEVTNKMISFIGKTNELVGKDLLGGDSMTLYRGVKPEYFKNLGIDIPKVGDKITVAENALSSWSVKPASADQFGAVVMKGEFQWGDIFGGMFNFTGKYAKIFSSDYEFLVRFKSNTADVIIHMVTEDRLIPTALKNKTTKLAIKILKEAGKIPK